MIENKIASSGLLNFDLSDFGPKHKVIALDIAPWLWESLALKESLFLEHLNAHDWIIYENKYVAINCSVDAIIPNWAYMMIVVKLHSIAKGCYLGTVETYNTHLYIKAIENLSTDTFKDAKVLIKGCGNVPNKAFVAAAERLMPVVKSIMFGEACSNIPLYKKK